MPIPLVNLQRQHEELHDEIRDAIDAVIDRSDFVLGPEVEAFEEAFAAYCETPYCVGTGSGLDALTLALRGFGISAGDEVITVANASVAPALAIRQTGATPVFVDHDPAKYTLDPRRLSTAVTSRTKAVIPVHLYGNPADMESIQAIANEHDLLIIEDACQAHGARYRGRRCGSFGHAAAFSFHPDRNLGALGDSGAVVTSDESLAKWLRAARNYGATDQHRHNVPGVSSRVDNLQAAVLRLKLEFLDEWNERRRWLASQYAGLLDSALVALPAEPEDAEHVYHRFVIRCPYRGALLERLHERGIGAEVPYPIPVHQQVAFGRGCMAPGPLRNTETYCESLLALPLCPFLTLDDLETVAHEVRTGLAELSAVLRPVSGQSV